MADDISTGKQGPHAEIKRRYGRKWHTKLKGERIRSLRRAQVLGLLRDRHGKSLPDDAGGRAALQLLFELGLDGVAAQHIAPWADGREIDRLIEAADANGAAWSKPDKAADLTIAEKIGHRLEVTFEEFSRLQLTHVRPCDTLRCDVADYLRDRAREGNSRRKRRAREEAEAAKPPVSADPSGLPYGRAKSLALRPLSNGEWWSVRALTDFVREHLGFFGGLDHAAARKAVLRAIRELEKLGMAETKKEPGQRGLPVLCVRRRWSAAEIESYRQQMLNELTTDECEEVTDVGA